MAEFNKDIFDRLPTSEQDKVFVTFDKITTNVGDINYSEKIRLAEGETLYFPNDFILNQKGEIKNVTSSYDLNIEEIETASDIATIRKGVFKNAKLTGVNSLYLNLDEIGKWDKFVNKRFYQYTKNRAYQFGDENSEEMLTNGVETYYKDSQPNVYDFDNDSFMIYKGDKIQIGTGDSEICPEVRLRYVVKIRKGE